VITRWAQTNNNKTNEISHFVPRPVPNFRTRQSLQGLLYPVVSLTSRNNNTPGQQGRQRIAIHGATKTKESTFADSFVDVDVDDNVDDVVVQFH